MVPVSTCRIPSIYAETMMTWFLHLNMHDIVSGSSPDFFPSTDSRICHAALGCPLSEPVLCGSPTPFPVPAWWRRGLAESVTGCTLGG